MKFKIQNRYNIQKFENICTEHHLLIRYTTPNFPYESEIKIGPFCIDNLHFCCHDVENPISEFNKKIMLAYPQFYTTGIVYFPEDGGKQILHPVETHRKVRGHPELGGHTGRPLQPGRLHVHKSRQL